MDVPAHVRYICTAYILFADLTELKAHFHGLLRSMPDDYMQTIVTLQKYFTDDQLRIVLNSDNSTIANKLILDYLIEGISCKEELRDIYDQLDNINRSHDSISKRYGQSCYCTQL